MSHAAGPGWAALPDVVRTRTGLLAGVNGGTPDMREFKGIPYAAPPVGRLRWRSPQPINKWGGAQGGPVWTAVHAAHWPCWGESRSAGCCAAVYERGLFVPQCVAGGRFCLRPATGDRVVSGGALAIGDGSRYNGEMLALQGAVVITYNYRIGASVSLRILS